MMTRHTVDGNPDLARLRTATALLMAAGLAGAASCGPSGDPAPAADRAAGDTSPAAAPRPVTDARFRTLAGETASLADYRGRVVVVNLWGTWCVPCRRELPELVEVDRAFADRGVSVIGIAVDSGEPEAIRAFADDYGVRYPIWVTDMPTALAEFRAVGYPFTLLVSRDGTIRDQFYGAQSLESLAPRIEALLD